MRAAQTKAREKKKEWRFWLYGYMAAFFMLFILSSCGNDRRIVLTTGFDKGEIFRLEGVSCMQAEALVYMTNMRNQYENTFGSQIWSTDVGDRSLQETVKQTVLARLAKIKMMNLMAAEYGIVLTKEEENAAETAAKEYFTSLSKEEIEAMGSVTRAQIEQMYREYALAEKLYDHIVENVNPEFSDDEARSVVLEQIFIANTTDGSDAGNSEGNVSTSGALSVAKALYNRMREEDVPYDEIAGEYNQAESPTITVCRGDLEPEIEEYVFSMGENQISTVLEAQDGCYIFRCISTNDETQTQQRKEEMVREAKMEAFDSAYETFSSGKQCYLNEELWNSLVFPSDVSVTTDSFFAVYEKYFG